MMQTEVMFGFSAHTATRHSLSPAGNDVPSIVDHPSFGYCKNHTKPTNTLQEKKPLSYAVTAHALTLQVVNVSSIQMDAKCTFKLTAESINFLPYLTYT